MPETPYIDTYVAVSFRDESCDSAGAQPCVTSARGRSRCRVIRDDGKLRWVRDTGEPVVDDGGKVVSLRGVMQDIDAERRGLEQQLEAHELFARLFQLMPDPTGITQGIGRYLV